MKFFMKLERRFAHRKMPNLMIGLVGLYAIGGMLFFTNPTLYFQYLGLNFDMIFGFGQVWRLITFLLFPISGNVFFMLIALYVYFLIAKAMERLWGTFRLNFIIVSGVIVTILTAAAARYIFQLPIGFGTYQIGNNYLNLSLFLFIALSMPEQQFLFYFIVPVKAKYIAILDLVLFGFAIYGGGGGRIEAIAALLNLVFVFLIINGGFSFKQRKRRRQFQRAGNTKRHVPPGSQRVERSSAKPHHEFKPVPKHRCTACGVTDLDEPDMDFRYCSKCNGMFEYCEKHIRDHEHL
ncbi:MAG: hypothetical protein Q4P30_01045 [Eubacteriales bacterium]|nr:hypothetical protein [Eubacteriales bacterium]